MKVLKENAEEKNNFDEATGNRIGWGIIRL